MHEPTLDESVLRPTHAEVDHEAIAHNYLAIAAHVGRPVMPILEANAYGHCLVEVAQTLERLGAPVFGIRTPILVLGGVWCLHVRDNGSPRWVIDQGGGVALIVWTLEDVLAFWMAADAAAEGSVRRDPLRAVATGAADVDGRRLEACETGDWRLIYQWMRTATLERVVGLPPWAAVAACPGRAPDRTTSSRPPSDRPRTPGGATLERGTGKPSMVLERRSRRRAVGAHVCCDIQHLAP